VTHNVGRLLKEAALKKLDVPPSILKKFERLYASLTQNGQSPPSSPTVGWLYMPMYLPERERLGQAAAEGSYANRLILSGAGSGVVVAPGLVLTNRSVVRDDEMGMVEQVRLRDPADPAQRRELPASLVAISEEHDLALLKCDSLQSPASHFSLVSPAVGTEIVALGFSTASTESRKVKTTKASITSTAEESNGLHLLFEMETGGVRGGPVLQKSGEFCGLISPQYKIKGSSKLAAVIPSSTVNAFLKAALNEAESSAEPGVADGAAVELDWNDAITRGVASSIAVHCYHRAVPLATTAEHHQQTSDGRLTSLEDILCSMCNGTHEAACPHKTCNKGVVTRRENYTEMVGTTQKQKINKVRYVPEACPVCDGKGHVKCQACSNGKDPTLRGR
jgi:Trypsin-like peptidase domain